MDKTQATLEALQDIEQLPAPATGNIAFYAGLALCLCLLLFITMRAYRWMSGKRSRASRKLVGIKKEIAGRPLEPDDSRIIAYGIARILSEGIDCNGITQTTALPSPLELHVQRWSSFRERLATARYADGGTLTAGQLADLIDEARFWLRKWP